MSEELKPKFRHPLQDAFDPDEVIKLVGDYSIAKRRISEIEQALLEAKGSLITITEFVLPAYKVQKIAREALASISALNLGEKEAN